MGIILESATTKQFSLGLVYEGVMEEKLQPMPCQANFTEGFLQLPSLGFGVFFVVGHNGKVVMLMPLPWDRPYPAR